jgi:hypothetical protein
MRLDQLVAENLFWILSFSVALVVGLMLLWRRPKPGYKELKKNVEERDVAGGLKTLFTRRLFGFADTVDRPLFRREIIIVLVFFVVMMIVVFSSKLGF